MLIHNFLSNFNDIKFMSFDLGIGCVGGKGGDSIAVAKGASKTEVGLPLHKW